MGMQSAQVQSGTQPQGKGFSNRMSPLPSNQSDGQMMSQMIGGMSNRMRVKQMPDAQGEQFAGLAVEPDSMNNIQTMGGYQQPAQNQGKGGSTTNAATSGQPTFGQPNRYPNTVGQWDNASIQRQSPTGGGKGKG